MAAIAAGHSAVAGEERLEPDQRLLEALELAVRTREGVDTAALADDEALMDSWIATPAAPCSAFGAGCSERSRVPASGPVRTA